MGSDKVPHATSSLIVNVARDCGTATVEGAVGFHAVSLDAAKCLGCQDGIRGKYSLRRGSRSEEHRKTRCLDGSCRGLSRQSPSAIPSLSARLGGRWHPRNAV